MDIKSKSKYLVVIWALLVSFGLSGLFSAFTNGSQFLQGDYFESEEYGYQMNRFVSLLQVFELNSMTKEEMKKEITVSDEEIEEHRTRYGNMGDQIANIGMQYEQQIQDAKDSGNKAVVDALTKERDTKIADITENFNSDEHVQAKIVKEKEKRIDEFYKELEKYRRQFVNFGRAYKYYMEDADTGEVFTNLNLKEGDSVSDFINNKEMYFVQDYGEIQEFYGYTGISEQFIPYNEVAEDILSRQNSNFTGKIGLSKNAPASLQAIGDYRYFQKRQMLFIGYMIASIGALIAAYIIARRKPAIVFGTFENFKPMYAKVPLDVRLGIMLATSGFFLLSLTLISEQFVYYNSDILSSLIELLISMTAAAALLAFGLMQLKSIAEYRNDGQQLKEDLQKSLVFKAYKAIVDAFLVRSIGIQLIVLLGFVFGLGMIAAAVFVEPGFIVIFGLAFIFIGLPLLIIIMKKAGYFNKILLNTEELAAGKMGSDIPVKGKSVFARHAADINTLRNSVKVSHKEQAKSERLKTELITNVSHDLRTPLTSIITYTELLKTPDLAPEDRASYIEILDRKSKRLKVLIDDLFEATKMASGNIELRKDRVDLIQLLQQALAEHNEALSQSSLHLRVSQPDHPVYAFVDGQKLWRVFDNLIGNILKYSLENSRVYISVKAEQDQAVLTFKNVTKYELGEDLDELFERFKRGDQSRHTEGSGLGLAIAKSIVDLHEGTLDIEVDGDLFKVTVILDKIS
ncbi:HAMP domain-containing sensor histidine kinase [Bacillus sp. JJ1122]|uniref:sensor histidine kinase n=1 Tax=Bacillus sp. JJ1122 TaxID=3122951 RepID=UPI002FFE6D84